MLEFAENSSLISHPWRILITSLELTNGTITNPLLLFYVEHGLVSTKINHSIEYNPVESFNYFG